MVGNHPTHVDPGPGILGLHPGHKKNHVIHPFRASSVTAPLAFYKNKKIADTKSLCSGVWGIFNTLAITCAKSWLLY
jgi:hypothetical protein